MKPTQDKENCILTNVTCSLNVYNYTELEDNQLIVVQETAVRQVSKHCFNSKPEDSTIASTGHLEQSPIVFSMC